MTEARRTSHDDARLLHLVEAYCNELATADEFAELERLLASDRGAREFYFRYMAIESVLECDSGSSGPLQNFRPLTVGRRAGRRTLFFSGLAAAVSVCLLAVAVILPGRVPDDPRQPPTAVGVIEQSSGPVTIVGADGQVRGGKTGGKLLAGDTVRTQASLAAVTFAFPDGSHFSLVGRTSATIHSAQARSLTVHGGTLFASVADQPDDHVLRVVTPADRLEILGTRFLLDAAAESTDLSVREGSVRLVHLLDGRSVVVPAGQRVVSGADSDMNLRPIPTAPEEWSVGFADGLPPGWGVGRLTTDDVPPQLGAAVEAMPVSEKDGTPYEIATRNGWTYGLFTVHDDSHLRFDFRMQRPGWFNILILTRTAEGDPPTFAGNYLFDEPAWEPKQPGQWFTATIPLSMFRPLPPSRPAFENAVPFQLLFSSPQEDRGLAMGQISVSRGGPGRVLVEEMPE